MEQQWCVGESRGEAKAPQPLWGPAPGPCCLHPFPHPCCFECFSLHGAWPWHCRALGTLGGGHLLTPIGDPRYRPCPLPVRTPPSQVSGLRERLPGAAAAAMSEVVTQWHPFSASLCAKQAESVMGRPTHSAASASPGQVPCPPRPPLSLGFLLCPSDCEALSPGHLGAAAAGNSPWLWCCVSLPRARHSVRL